MYFTFKWRYLFGGFAQERYNSLLLYHPGWNLWKKVEVKKNSIAHSTFESIVPNGRFYHSMNIWKHNIIIFGGAGDYIKRLKARESFNDLWIFNISHWKWKNRSLNLSTKNPNIPQPRLEHAAAVINCCLLGKLVWNITFISLFSVWWNKRRVKKIFRWFLMI